MLVAVLFTDIVGSTERAAELGDRRWRELLDEHDRRVRRAVEAAAGQVVKTPAMACWRVSTAPRAQSLRASPRRRGKATRIPVRAGIHVGECDQRGEDIGGMTVHVAARVMALSGANEVIVTSTVREALLGTEISFDPCGTETLRGVPGEWSVFAVRS